MPSKQPKFISVVIPSYNQEKTIVRNLKRLHTALQKTNYEYEIIVVVDGKVDSTVEKLKKAALPRTTLVYYEKNRGKSYAIRLGMSKARGEHVMFIDAGNEIDPEGMQMLFLHLQWYDADIIVGSKRHMASIVNYTWQRKILSWGYYIFVKILFGLKIRDTQAGIKVFRKEVLEAILPRLIEKRFAGDLEMLVVAKKLGFKRIFEAPIKLNYNFAEISSAATLSSILKIFLDTLAVFYRSNFLKYYDSVHSRTREPEDMKVVRY
jgi:glycosyltransferase involved in cell wall biosynthesis